LILVVGMLTGAGDRNLQQTHRTADIRPGILATKVPLVVLSADYLLAVRRAVRKFGRARAGSTAILRHDDYPFPGGN
jgi:hypothetical protein